MLRAVFQELAKARSSPAGDSDQVPAGERPARIGAPGFSLVGSSLDEGDGGDDRDDGEF